MSFAIGVIIFVIGLLVSIALHEVGHLVPAKLFGVKVPGYFVGFGRTLWSTRRGDTEYGVKLLPLGGYVRLAGMYPPAAGAPERRANGQLTLAEEARRDTRADLAPGEEHRAFSALSVPRKLVVMAGGPLMNLLIAAVLLTVMLVGIGTSFATSTLAVVQPCLSSAECTAADPASPAATAGFQPGDRVLTWGGTEVAAWTDISTLIRDGGTAPVDVVVSRAGQEVALTVVPVELERPVYDANGKAVLQDGVPVTEALPYVGISPASELRRQSITAVPPLLVDVTAQTFGVILHLPQQLWGVAQSLVTGEERDASVIGIVGVGRFAGEITSVESDKYGIAARAVDLMGLLVSLNIALFAFNVIPLPPLDGGHIAGALVEGARRGWARVRGMTAPRPVDMARLLPLTYGVVAVLVGMGVLLALADIVRPVTL